jgi:hypothetical protein
LNFSKKDSDRQGHWQVDSLRGGTAVCRWFRESL